jgi:hypothetical protein
MATRRKTKRRRGTIPRTELPVPAGSQEAVDWCGPATLQLFLMCWGLRFSQTRLARDSGTTWEDGTTARGVKRIMRLVGIRYYTKVWAKLKTIEEALKRRKPTLIAYTEPTDEEGHYAIPVRIGSKYIWLRDVWNSPRKKSKARRSFRLTRDEFYERWAQQQCWILIPRKAPKW